MAVWYVYSGAAGTATGADWTNAKTTLAAAFTAGAAGDTYYVAHDHAETQATANALTPKGTAAAPDKIICVNRAGSVPPVSADLSTTGSISTTGASATLTVNNGTSAYAYWYGIVFQTGSGANSANIQSSGVSSWNSFKNCTFNLLSTASSVFIASTNGVALPNTYENCSLSVNSTSAQIRMNGRALWINSTIVTGATIPTTLLNNTGSNAVAIRFDGCDFSALGSGKTLVQASVSATVLQLINCKLGASVTIAATPTVRGARVEVINCDSGTANYRNEIYAYEGTLTTETTIIPASQQASDGTTPVTWKVATTANVAWLAPFETFTYSEWCDTTGSALTRTFEIVNDGTTLTNAEVWAECEYLGSSTQPLSSLATSGVADILASGSNLTTSSATWTTTGLASPVKQKVAVTFTPQMKGYFRIVFKVARASKTVYINPRPNEA